MRFILGIVLVVVSTFSCAQSTLSAEALVEAIRSSHAALLASLHVLPHDNAKEQLLQARFAELTTALELKVPVKLLVVSDYDIIGRAFPGNVIAVNEALANEPREVQFFIIAHELGHVEHGHFARFEGFAFAVREAEIASHQQLSLDDENGVALKKHMHDMEFEADAHASQILKGIQVPVSGGIAFLARFKKSGDSFTHPSSDARILRLQQLD